MLLYRYTLFVVVTILLQAAGCKKSESNEPPTLRGLPYLASKEISDKEAGKRGLTHHVPELSAAGYTLIVPHSQDYMRIVAADGSLHRRIELPSQSVSVVPQGDKGFLVQGKNHIFLLDPGGKEVWRSKKRRYHHWVESVDDDRIFALAMEPRVQNRKGEKKQVVTDLLVELDDQGQELRTWDLFRIFADHVSQEDWNRVPRPVAEKWHEYMYWDTRDLLHTNYVEYVDRDIGIARKGQLLISLRNPSTIAVLDLDQESVTWHWGPGQLLQQHDPVLLANNNLLIFDNQVETRGSRVIELDPRSKKVVWSSEDVGLKFFTRERGHAQPLSNGNILISESDNGRILEVTRSGQVVWEYWTEVRPASRHYQNLNSERMLFQRALRIETTHPLYQLLSEQE